MASDQEDSTNGTTAISAPTPVVGYEEAQFTGAAGGGVAPNGNVLIDNNGDVFGTTAAGGTGNLGTIFEAPVPSGGGQISSPVTLTSFSNYTAPAGASLFPGNLTMDTTGNIFGTTETGGTTKSSYGTIFELPKTSTGYAANPTPIVSFKPRFGTTPENLTMVGQDLFGVTVSGRGGGNQGGTVFEVAPNRHGTYPARPHVLTAFRGAERITSNLLVTPTGVIGAVAGGQAGAGEIFELKQNRPNGPFQRRPTILEKGVSAQNLATDSSGNIFAVSSGGGADHQGAVYELGKTSKGYGAPTDLLDFNGSNGADPTGITLDSSGNIFGTTHTGGTYGYGAMFGIDKTSTGYQATNTIPFSGQHSVIGADSIVGANPVGSPTLLGNVFLDGTTQAGGSANAGTVYGLVATGDFSPTNAGGSAAGTSNAAVNHAAVANNAVEAPAAAAAAVCFAEGTRIRTATGEVAVEALAVGDLVVTASGEIRPVTWRGHRTLDCRRHPRPHEVMPIRIAAHAFAPGRPARDLLVSPGHAICVDVMGEMLIPAASLVNGTTITQVEVARVTYWHVELGSHDIVLAEGVACESYLEMGNRRFFNEAGIVTLAATPDATSVRTHADFCRPYHATGPLVDVVRAALDARAEAIWASRAAAEERLAS